MTDELLEMRTARFLKGNGSIEIVPLPSMPTLIRSARQKSGLTQAQAGALIHAPLRTWQDWEYGKRNMPQAKWELFKLRAAKM